MKHNQQFQTLAVLLLSLSLTFSYPELSDATGKGQFFCDKHQGQWNTFVKRPKRNIAIIEWTSDYFAESGWSNQKRCRVVSDRFNQYVVRLQNAKVSTVNGYPVVCVPKVKSGNCGKNEVLVTLKKGSNAEAIVEKLFNINGYGSPSKFNFTNQPFSYDSKGELNINIDSFIDTLEQVIEASEGNKSQ